MSEARRLGDRYELGEVLGYGGMAEVHRGRDIRLGRDVAVKTLRVDLARDPTFQSRFRREAQSAASLNHPSVVAVYDTGEDSLDGVNVPYIVMEYVDGRTLRDILHAEHAIMPTRALEITADVLRALDYSHRTGIVHRDIKPGNVMLTRAGEVKVMDFGIARAVAESSATVTQTAAVIGTAQYLSPEQARGEKVDPRSDIYSTGCLLYELLTGAPPFTGDSPVAVAYQHVREDPLPPSRVNPDVSPAVDAIVLKAMAKNPANRYQTAAEMRDDIERALSGRPVEATPVLMDPTVQIPAVTGAAAATQAWQEPRRGRGWIYVLLAVAVIAVLVGVGFLVKELLTSSDTATVAVPDVVTKTQEEATKTLTDAGFVVDPVEASNDAEKGTVFNQSPVSGTKLAKGKTVQIFVSTGPGEQTIPSDIVGKPFDQAKATLEGLGFVVADPPTKQDSPKAANIVLSSSPAAGSPAKSGDTVTLTVASGNNQVPDVRRWAVADAEQQLQDSGFTTKQVPQQDASAKAGTVLNMQPSPNQSLPLGTEITLFVAEAPPAPPTTAPPQTSAPPATTAPPASPVAASPGA